MVGADGSNGKDGIFCGKEKMQMSVYYSIGSILLGLAAWWIPNLRRRGKGHMVSLSKPFPAVPETAGRKAAQVRLKGTINRKFDGMVIL